MTTVQKATIEIFDKIFPLIEYFAIDGMERESWFLLLSKKRSARHDHFGYVLLDGDSVVGFLGAFFAERNIDGKLCSICNLFCWHVLEDYRRESLLLLRPILNLQNTTITALTSSLGATVIYKRFKFKELEAQVKIFPFMPSLSLRTDIEYLTDPDLIQSRLLIEEEKKIVTDHTFPSCCHLLLADRRTGEYCYLVYNRVRKKGLHFTQVCFISNKDLFVKIFARLQWYFLRRNRTLFTIVDKRLIGDSKPGPGYSYSLRYPRLYHSDTLQPEQIDNLYSELLFLERV